MKEQKVIITSSQIEINGLISKGWFVISVTPQVVSSVAGYSSMRGEFCFVLEREISKKPA